MSPTSPAFPDLEHEQEPKGQTESRVRGLPLNSVDPVCTPRSWGPTPESSPRLTAVPPSAWSYPSEWSSWSWAPAWTQGQHMSANHPLPAAPWWHSSPSIWLSSWPMSTALPSVSLQNTPTAQTESTEREWRRHPDQRTAAPKWIWTSGSRRREAGWYQEAPEGSAGRPQGANTEKAQENRRRAAQRKRKAQGAA